MRKTRQELDREFEELEAISKPGKEGVKNAQQVFQDKEKQEEKQKAVVLETLSKFRSGSIVTYNRLLAELLLKRLAYVDWQGFRYQVAPTDKGVVMQINSPDGRMFACGFKPTGLPQYDLNAIDTYALRAENTIDRVLGNDRRTK